MKHDFTGKWITDEEFSNLPPRNVFHKQLDKVHLPCDRHRNRHILFRKKFHLDRAVAKADIYISGDDYYKLYINGRFVSQGPTPAYHFQYNYNTIDVTDFLTEGENTLAVHTLYQGLINRVWQSGDQRHGLILDLVAEGKTIVSSDETFKTAPHSGYTATGTCGYDTQFLEDYDSSSKEEGFILPDYDHSQWKNASLCQYNDRTLVEQESKMLEFEDILPVNIKEDGNSVIYDFGSVYVGYFCAAAKGRKGDVVTVKCAQELNEDGSLRHNLRANCVYEEKWILSDKESSLDWFDYKSFRYVQLSFPQGVEISNVFLNARHYPFALKAELKPKYSKDKELDKVWELCVRTQKYGVQELIQDCMEREKGFYVGDGCYTALTNMILTKDDSMVRRLIDDAFVSDFITDTLVTCLNCSFMQEIAEYPLILISLVLWHYNYTKDRNYLEANLPKVIKLLEAYRKNYEKNHLLKELDKWCVVEWPANFRHGYDVDIQEGRVCHQAHVSINAYYIFAIRTANRIAEILGREKYRDEAPLLEAFNNAFWDKEKGLFKDGEDTDHISLVGNSFVYGFDLCKDKVFKDNFISLFSQNQIHALSFFCSFPVLHGLVLNERTDIIDECMSDPEAWKRILREGGTVTFEGWGKDTKWNTSLFHLTMSYGAVFLADIDLGKIFDTEGKYHE